MNWRTYLSGTLMKTEWNIVLADVRRPQVMIESESFVLGADKINLLDDNDVQRPPS